MHQDLQCSQRISDVVGNGGGAVGGGDVGGDEQARFGIVRWPGTGGASTVAPASRSRSAMAAPVPLLAPVTSARRPSSRSLMLMQARLDVVSSSCVQRGVSRRERVKPEAG
jgi:hypothetical protein